MLADNEMDLHTSRLVIWHCAWVLDQGGKGRHEFSMTKVLCSEAEWRVVDRSVQIRGANGVSDETVAERIFRGQRCTAGAWPIGSRADSSPQNRPFGRSYAAQPWLRICSSRCPVSATLIDRQRGSSQQVIHFQERSGDSE